MSSSTPPPPPMTTTSRGSSPHPIPPPPFGAGLTPRALVLSPQERDRPAAASVLSPLSPLLLSICLSGRNREEIPSATTMATTTIDCHCDPQSQGGEETASLSSPPCHPAGTLPSSTSECDQRRPTTNPRIWLRRMPSNRNTRSPPGIVIAVVVVDGGVAVVVTTNRQSRFLLAAGRGARTVAFAPDPPVSPPVAGPWHHLPPQQ
jgi:hypothetical protein